MVLSMIFIELILIAVNATDEIVTSKSILIQEDDSVANVSVLLYASKEIAVFRSLGYISLCLYKD